MIFKQQTYIAGAYERLSDDDEQEGESCSIETQNYINTQFCEVRGIEIYDHYVDDGYTGTNFDRPNFKRMLRDVENGKINLVIVKNLARFGRDYVDNGYYIEKIFDNYNVRFIAIEDDVDTLKGDNMIMPFKNIFNAMYPKEVSKSTKNALDARAKKGFYLASKAAYGYDKHPEDNHKVIPDSEPAGIINTMFNLAKNSYGYNAIARYLTKNKILTPQSYLVTKYPDYFKKKVFKPHCQWNIKTVQVILHNKIYLGHTIHGKTRSKTIRSKVKSFRPEDEWIVVENTHAPIVSQELWDAAHTNLASRRKSYITNGVHIFSGFLFCKDCGASMTFNNRDLKKAELNGEFMCGTYKRKGKDQCTTHYITYESIYNVILQNIRSKAALANESAERFMASLEKENKKLLAEKTSYLLKDLGQAKVRIDELDQIINSLFEQQALGKIPPERFDTMYASYESEQTELKVKVRAAERIQKQSADQAEKLQRFIGIIKDAVDVETLNTDILSKIVKRITVGQAVENPGTGEKQQDIHVEFAYSA